MEEHSEGLVALARADASLSPGGLDRARARFGPDFWPEGRLEPRFSGEVAEWLKAYAC